MNRINRLGSFAEPQVSGSGGGEASEAESLFAFGRLMCSILQCSLVFLEIIFIT